MPVVFAHGPVVQTSQDFVEDFSGTANPISGTTHQRGGSEGTNWSNPQTTGGQCVGTVFDSGFNDSIAHVKTSVRTFNANQFGRATVYKAPGYAPDAGTDQEVEILLRFTITSGSATGYEFLYGIDDGGMALVRWNGPQGNFTELIGDHFGFAGPSANGNVIYCAISGNIVSCNVNGTNAPTINGYDITSGGAHYDSGQPGFGFFTAQNGGGNADFTKFGFSAWRAGNL